MNLDTLLHPTDFSDCADHALRRALLLARDHDARLHVVHVALPDVDHSYELENAPLLDDLEAHVTEQGVEDVDVEVALLRSGATHRAIVEYADDLGADMIVMGTHGRRGIDRLVVGSTTERVIREADAPVLAVRRRDGVPPGRPIRHVVVPTDFSDYSVAALNPARSFAATYEARLTLLHVIEGANLPGVYGDVPDPLADTPQLRGRVRTRLAEMVDEELSDIEAEYHVEAGSAAGSILDVATERGADLIVMSSHGHTGLKRFLLGSVTEKVLRQTPCPLLVVNTMSDE